MLIFHVLHSHVLIFFWSSYYVFQNLWLGTTSFTFLCPTRAPNITSHHRTQELERIISFNAITSQKSKLRSRSLDDVCKVRRLINYKCRVKPGIPVFSPLCHPACATRASPHIPSNNSPTVEETLPGRAHSDHDDTVPVQLLS